MLTVLSDFLFFEVVASKVNAVFLYLLEIVVPANHDLLAVVADPSWVAPKRHVLDAFKSRREVLAQGHARHDLITRRIITPRDKNEPSFGSQPLVFLYQLSKFFKVELDAVEV